MKCHKILALVVSYPAAIEYPVFIVEDQAWNQCPAEGHQHLAAVDD